VVVVPGVAGSAGWAVMAGRDAEEGVAAGVAGAAGADAVCVHPAVRMDSTSMRGKITRKELCIEMGIFR
jgi:hypothetical protein